MDSNRPIDISVLHDVFCETATALSGRYVALARQTSDQEEEQRWRGRVMQLRDKRRRASPADRSALVERVEQWKRELRELGAR